MPSNFVSSLRQCLSANPKLISLARPADPQAPEICLSSLLVVLALGLQTRADTLGVLCGWRGFPTHSLMFALQVPSSLRYLPSLLISTLFKLVNRCGQMFFSLFPIPLTHQDHIHAHLQNVRAVLIPSDKDAGHKDHNLQF